MPKREVWVRSHRAVAAAASLVVVIGVACTPPDSGVRAVPDDPNRTTTTTLAPKGPTPEYLARVAATSTEQEPGRYMVAVVQPGSPNEPSVSLNGYFDVTTGRRRMMADLRQVFELVGLSRQPSGTTVPPGPAGRPSAETSGAVLDLFTEPLDVVYDADAAVLFSPALTRKLDDPSRPWVRVTGGFELPTDRLGIGPSRDTARALIDALQGADADIAEVGIEPFYGGDEATHYSAFLDLSEAATALPSEERERFQHGLAGLGVESALVEIWVDAHDHLRRIEVPLRSARVRATLIAQYDEYGKPQSIELPPADQVQDAPELGGLLRPR